MNVPKTYDVTVADFTDCGRLINPNGNDANLIGITIDTDDGQSHIIEGFDYASHLLGDVIVCSCGDQIDPHQIALFTHKREHILIPARCCKKFRWFKGEEV